MAKKQFNQAVKEINNAWKHGHITLDERIEMLSLLPTVNN